MKRLKRPFALIVGICAVILGGVWAVYAQDATPVPPDYAITDFTSQVTASAEMVVSFTVGNIGGPASANAVAELIVRDTGQRVGLATLGPLNTNDARTVRLTFPAAQFPPCSVQVMRATVGIGEIEPLGPSSENNTATLSVTFPPPAGDTCDGVGAAGGATGGTANPLADVAAQVYSLLDRAGVPRTLAVPILEQPLNLRDPMVLAVLFGVILTLFLGLWFMLVLVRRALAKPPLFGGGRPPYTVYNNIDANTVGGRRALWQQYTQNGTLPPTAQEGSVHGRKLLLGVDGRLLSGWQIKAVRISQYDSYGRVAHTQTVAPKALTTQLVRAAKTRPNLKRSPAERQKALTRQVRGLAQYLANGLKRKLNSRNAMLPIALDVRLEGTHGEVLIVFELYQCQYGQLRQIDGWQPEMMVNSKIIHESLTYSVSGLQPGEKLHDLKKRLHVDIGFALSEVVMNSTPVAPPEVTPVGISTSPSPMGSPTPASTPANAATPTPATQGKAMPAYTPQPSQPPAAPTLAGGQIPTVGGDPWSRPTANATPEPPKDATISALLDDDFNQATNQHQPPPA
jgi:hypothetical protein